MAEEKSLGNFNHIEKVFLSDCTIAKQVTEELGLHSSWNNDGEIFLDRTQTHYISQLYFIITSAKKTHRSVTSFL